MKDEYLSPHFKRSEFACRCGCGFGLGDGDVDPRLVDALEELRAKVDAPVIVLSGCRCPARNAQVGGKKKSTHLRGLAADVRVKDWWPAGLAREAEKVDAFRNGGIGVYAWGVHLDVGDGPRRW